MAYGVPNASPRFKVRLLVTSPVVLEESGENIAALPPGAAIDSAAYLRGQPEKEVCFRQAASAAGGASGPGPAVYRAVKSERSGAPIVSGVESIDSSDAIPGIRRASCARLW